MGVVAAGSEALEQQQQQSQAAREERPNKRMLYPAGKIYHLVPLHLVPHPVAQPAHMDGEGSECRADGAASSAEVGP